MTTGYEAGCYRDIGTIASALRSIDHSLLDLPNVLTR